MDTFFHIRMVLSIIMSLSIAHLLKGAVKIIEHPTKNRPYWIHLLWAAYIFLMLIHFWWWEIHLSMIRHWLFTKYIFVVSFIILYYVLCVLLFPDDMSEYGTFENYYFSRKNWFFSVLALTFAIDVIDTLLKGREYARHLGWEYPVRNAVHFILCIAAIFVFNKKFHAILAILFILYELSWILRLYNNS
jgi:hypothetical protein